MPIIFLIVAGAVAVLFIMKGSASGQADASTICQVQSSGQKLSPSDIAQYAQQAGFAGDDLTTAVAIALAESGGDPGAYNPVKNLDSGKPANTPTDMGAVGLWQIYIKAHPQYTRAQLEDPANNAAAAFQTYSDAGRSFHPWTTFTNGAYQANVNLAADGVASISGTMTPDQATLTEVPACGACSGCCGVS